jgi:LmbE family N-acetylglucosaminyl deacetylase
LGTLVTFHAHPDDESIATGGVIAQAAKLGHRVVLVVATRGEHGEVNEGVLREGELLGDRRTEEMTRAAEILGIERVEFLGYIDSGMMGTPENDAPGSFWTADVEEAAGRLAAILREEDAEVVTVYDSHGGYDHPDHIQVHRVGVRAAELAGTPRVYEVTMNRDQIRRFMLERRNELEASGTDVPVEVQDPEQITMGTPDAEITTVVDVREFIATKRAALAAHASQVDETSFFLAMPEVAFLEAFGREWFIRRGIASPAVPEDRETSLF